MEINRVIALRAKAIRTQRKLTLDSAAALTGVSRSMLAQIEKGEVNPTISVLWKIANGYKVSFTALLDGADSAVTVRRGSEAEPLSEAGGKYLNSPVFPFDEGRLFETYRIVIRPGGRLQAQPHLSGAEESITVFAGTAEITVAEEVYALAKGDSIRFQADVPHGYHNPGAEDAELSMLIYYRR